MGKYPSPAAYFPLSFGSFKAIIDTLLHHQYEARKSFLFDSFHPLTTKKLHAQMKRERLRLQEMTHAQLQTLAYDTIEGRGN